MYDNNNIDSFHENTNNETGAEQNTEPVTDTGFVLVDAPESDKANDTVNAASTGYAGAENAAADSSQTADTAQQGVYSGYTQQSDATAQSSASEDYTQQGAFSGQMQQTDAASQTYTSSTGGSGAQPFSARDIQPRKKTGWGKKILAVCLSGLLFGSCAAGAYLGITYLAGSRAQTEGRAAAGTDLEGVRKDLEISQVETVSTVKSESDSVAAGVAYDVSEVVENVMPAMVSIVNNYTETYNTIFGQTYTQQAASSGSGIIIGENDTEIIIATNYHVISGSDEIAITFADDSTATAYIKGSNPDMDLAVVSVPLDSLSAETKSSIAVAQLGDSDELKLGQPVIAIGNALGYGQSVTTGVVSAINREITNEDGVTGNFIQTDAAINPGNSGGALLNMNGQVIGINSSKIGGSTIEGMGYAIPISAAEPIISDLSLQTTKIKVEEADRGYLGISIREVSSSMSQAYGIPQGIYITEVVKGSAAEAAGLQARDVIVKFDTFEIEDTSDLQEALQYFAAGTTVNVEVMRIQNNEYQSVTLELTLGERPANQ